MDKLDNNMMCKCGCGELKTKGVEFDKHVALVGQPDLFIKPNICVFCDGDYWHNLPGSKEKDLRVTKKLEDDGYKVLRFWEKDINSDINGCVAEIEKHLVTDAYLGTTSLNKSQEYVC